MKGKTDSYFPSNDPLSSFYALGGGSSVDVLVRRSNSNDGSSNGNNNNNTAAAGGVVTTVLRSSPAAGGGGSGIHLSVLGAVPVSNQNVWGAGWNGAAAVPAAPAATWSTSVLIAPNDRNFPCLNLTTGPNMPDTDLEAYMTGVYGSSPGCLCTFDNEVRRNGEEDEGAGRPFSVCCTVYVVLLYAVCVLHGGVYRGAYCVRVCAVLNRVCVCVY